MKHVVALSGGKDSTALALALAEREPRDYLYVCTPTGNELPEMNEHWRKLEGMLGAPIMRLGNRTLFGLIMEQKAIPNHAQRWCTRMLKLETYYRWLGAQGECTSYVGLRADEQSRGGMQFKSVGDITMRFPLKEWGWDLAQVRQYLDDKDVTIPERTDCAVCFWQKLGEWFILWRDQPELFEQGVVAEEFVSKYRGKPVTFRSPQRDTWPASLRELRERFEAGDVPTVSLKRMEREGVCRACTL